MTDTARDRLLDIRIGDRWLVAVAHPDDESFGCGSTIDHAAALGAEVTVVCATRGEAGESTPGSPHGKNLGSVREGELRRAAARLGVGRVELLGYRDSGFDGDPPAGSLRAAPVSEVADAVSRLLRELRAPLLVEHCLPNGLLRRWLEEMQVLRPGTAYHSLDPATLGRDDAAITDVLDTTGVLDRRVAAMAEHRSQASPFDGLSPGLRRAFPATDLLTRVDVSRYLT